MRAGSSAKAVPFCHKSGVPYGVRVAVHVLIGSRVQAYSMLAESACVCSVALEEGFSQEAAAELEKRGHKIDAGISGHARGTFGRGQIIQRNPKTGVLWGGTDPRADGAVMAW